jgi:hypothetical protein
MLDRNCIKNKTVVGEYQLLGLPNISCSALKVIPVAAAGNP